MHPYPLHRPVLAICACCALQYDTTFTSKHDNVICPRCTRHSTGSHDAAKKTVEDHRVMVAAHVRLMADQQRSRLAELGTTIAKQNDELTAQRATIADLRQQIQIGIWKSPNPEVQEWLRRQLASEAYQDREEAYRIRDYAMRALLTIDLIHHPSEGDERKCTCGRTSHDCRTNLALSDEREYLYKWEAQQREHTRRGYASMPPESHPDYHPD